ncbi:MAG: pyruvate kinase alpha/beta domain-containing protein [Candidatus Bathyarchaeia archaeon]
MKKTTLYFEKTGPENTGILLSAAKKRAKKLGIRDIVVATTHGSTAIKAQEAFGPEANIVAVTISEGFTDKGWTIKESERKALEDKGIKVLTSTHALGGDVGSAFTDKYGGGYPARAVRDTLYRFGQGMKVAVEIVLMAADAGLIGMEGEVMAIAGTGDGADTCIVVKPAYPRKFFELEIREILAKPRTLS